jgi:predicted nucleotide-binding protein (sugar kinase/HSP70/actin superfamily)
MSSKEILKGRIRSGLKAFGLLPNHIKDDAVAIVLVAQRGGKNFLSVEEMNTINDFLDEMNKEFYILAHDS